MPNETMEEGWVNERDSSSIDRLTAQLEERGFVRGGFSKWGRPAPWKVEGEPQRLEDAVGLQRRLVECTYGTPSPGADLCASWVEQCFSRLGIGVVLGDARYLYQSYCIHTALEELKVGMIICVPAHPFSPAGMAHGHAGLYVGNRTVRDAVGEEVRTVPLDLWLATYGLVAEPRWGWLGSLGLS